MGGNSERWGWKRVGFTTGLAIMGFAGEVLKLWGGRVNREGKAFTEREREGIFLLYGLSVS